MKLHPADLYALSANHGGIDERWFASTTAAANEGAPPDEGLSYVVFDKQQAFTLRDAVRLMDEALVGPDQGFYQTKQSEGIFRIGTNVSPSSSAGPARRTTPASRH